MRIAIIGGNKVSNMLGINFVSNKISDALHPTGAAGFHPHDHRNVQAVGSVSFTARHGRVDTRRGRERMKATPKAAQRGEATHVRRGLRHVRRAINWAESATPEVGEDTMARAASRAVFACASILLLAAVAGCSDFSMWGKSDKPVDANAYPENYKKDVLTYVKAHPAEMPGRRCLPDVDVAPLKYHGWRIGLPVHSSVMQRPRTCTPIWRSLSCS